MVKTFWPRRAVALPTMRGAAPPAVAVVADLEAVASRLDALEQRLEALDADPAAERQHP
jgi:hypothetical protein